MDREFFERPFLIRDHLAGSEVESIFTPLGPPLPQIYTHYLRPGNLLVLGWVIYTERKILRRSLSSAVSGKWLPVGTRDHSAAQAP